MSVAGAVLGLALAGFTVSLYFTLAYYGRVRTYQVIPTVACEGVCLSILDTPYSHVFGLPNSLFGLAYYILLMAEASCRLVIGTWVGLAPLAVLSLFVAAFSIYLAWALLLKLHTFCPLCTLAQAINIIVAGLITAAWLA